MEPNEVDINAPMPAAASAEVPLEQPGIPTVEPAVPAAPQAPKEVSRLAPIRTFSSDMAEAIRTKGGSVVRIAIAEEEKRRRAYEDNSIRSKKNIALIIVSCLLIAGAVGVAWYGYVRRTTPPEEILAPQTAPSSIIPSEEYVTIDVTGLQVTDVFAKVQAAAAVPGIQAGAVKNLILVQGPAGARKAITTNQFLSALGASAPSELSRALKSDFMLGLYRYEKGDLFLIVHGSARDFLLAGMLTWERDLFSDMAPLFGIDISGYTKDELEAVRFVDAIVENRDARAVVGADGKPILFYSFIDQNTIVIASAPKAFFEVVRRY